MNELETLSRLSQLYQVRLKKLADEVKIIENGVEHPFGVKE